MNGPQKWFAVEITVAARAVEAIEFCFNELDTLGTWIDQFRELDREELTVIGYFASEIDLSAVDEQLQFSLRAYGLDRVAVRSIKQKELENADWLSEWKKHWRPTRVGRFVIAPSWEDVAGAPDNIVIRIEPNMAFGTGTHETTRSCLKAIDEHFRKGMSFLDVGTGTGILAIAAAKIGQGYPAEFLALDVDADAIEIAGKNAEQNNLVDKIEFVHGKLTTDQPVFDFVCANLTLDVIIPQLSLLVEKTKNILVLSGILAEQEEQIVGALKTRNIDKLRTERDGEWISVVIER